MDNASSTHSRNVPSSNLSVTPLAPQKVSTDPMRARAASAVDSQLPDPSNLSANSSAIFSQPRAHSDDASHTHGCGCPKLPEGGFYGK